MDTKNIGSAASHYYCHNLLFEKLTGRKIMVSRAEITDATAERWFKGKPSFAAGGKHLVINTRDGNRGGFLVGDAEMRVHEIMSS